MTLLERQQLEKGLLTAEMMIHTGRILAAEARLKLAEKRILESLEALQDETLISLLGEVLMLKTQIDLRRGQIAESLERMKTFKQSPYYRQMSVKFRWKFVEMYRQLLEEQKSETQEASAAAIDWLGFPQAQ